MPVNEVIKKHLSNPNEANKLKNTVFEWLWNENLQKSKQIEGIIDVH